MTDTPHLALVREHCNAHQAYDESCDRCVRANRSDRRGAPPLEPTEMRVSLRRAIEAAREIEAVYSDLYDIAYGRQVVGEGGRGTHKEYDNLGQQHVFELLQAVSDKVAGSGMKRDRAPGAVSLLAGAWSAIDQAAGVVDKRHTASDPLLVVGEKMVTKEELLTSSKRRLRQVRAEDDCHFGREARKLEKDISTLERQIAREAQLRREAEERAAGKATSKGQRKRSRRNTSGYVVVADEK